MPVVTEFMSKYQLAPLDELKELVIHQAGDSSRKAQGLRLRFLREFMGFERPDFSTMLGVGSAYKSWENGNQIIPRKRVHQIIQVFHEHLLDVSLEWLETGTCIFPDWNEEYKILRETDAFCQWNKNAVTLKLTDDAMKPQFNKEDIVAGCWENVDSFAFLIGKACIVELENGAQLFRIIRNGSEKGKFLLMGSDLQETSNNALLNNVIIKRAAIIKWHRRSAAK